MAGPETGRSGAGRGRQPSEAQVGRPPLYVLLTAPLFGALFAVFLPFIGFLVCGEVVVQKVRSLWRNADL
jgi:hypothetical protein